MVALSTEVRLLLLGHPAITRMTEIVMMVVKLVFDCTGMLTFGDAEPYCGPGTMVREGGVPANFS
jgi:hypothetical protein